MKKFLAVTAISTAIGSFVYKREQKKQQKAASKNPLNKFRNK